MNVLITGATGNVGGRLLQKLGATQHKLHVIAALKSGFSDTNATHYCNEPHYLDFTNPACFEKALKNIDTLFLVRPPQLSSVSKYFKPLINQAVISGVSHIVFLSVQGAETNSWIPHHKIEELIKQSGIAYTFLRPAYFVQNFLGNLNHDLVNSGKIYLPAGNAKFTLVDVGDLAEVAASVLLNLPSHINKAYTLTNNERLTFGEMAETLSGVLGKEIQYISPTLLQFFIKKKKEGMPIMLILVMIMLHYLPRFSNPPEVTNTVEEITEQRPQSFLEFTEAHKDELRQLGVGLFSDR